MAEQFGILMRIVVLVVAALLPLINPAGSAPIFQFDDAGDQRDRATENGGANWPELPFPGGSRDVHRIVRADFSGVSLTSVRIGGGLLVAASGWKLLNADEKTSTMTRDVKKVAARAFYPLTFPLTVGLGPFPQPSRSGGASRNRAWSYGRERWKACWVSRRWRVPFT